jgi:hypothetical protein
VTRARSGIAEQGPESLLLKMLIVRQNLGKPMLAHGLHGDAIGHAVVLVQTRAVKVETGYERSSRLEDADRANAFAFSCAMS